MPEYLSVNQNVETRDLYGKYAAAPATKIGGAPFSPLRSEPGRAKQ